MSCIDVEHGEDGISLTLESSGFSLNVRLSQSEADQLVEQLTTQQSDPNEPDAANQLPEESSRDTTRVGC